VAYFWAVKTHAFSDHVNTIKPPQIHHNLPPKNTVENAKTPEKTLPHHAQKNFV
jgi:hypothetical protein